MLFNSLNVHHHLVYNVAPQNHIEETHKKFKTSRINKLPSHFSFDTGTVLNLKRPQEHIFSCQRVKNSFSRGKRSSFEIKTILSHFSGSLKVVWRLNYPFPFNNKVIFHFVEYIITSKLACLILERNLIRVRFWSSARQPVLSCEQAVLQSTKVCYKL